MAEMTAAKVKMLLESFAAVCGSNSKAKELCGDAVGFVEQQAQEIERLQIREHRMIEYMRDVKNFAFTINEVANNAIEEAEVQE